MKYWLTPPELYAQLDSEFHFDFDPCPYPMTKNGLELDWGSSNYVNPPFTRDAGSPTAFVRKAIQEQKKGKTTVLILSTPSYVNLLLAARCELRAAGRVKWLSVEDNSPMPAPGPSTLFILRPVKE